MFLVVALAVGATTAGTAAHSTTAGAAAPPATAGISATATEPVIVHGVAPGETWGSLGARALLQPQDWLVIARRNGEAVDAPLRPGTALAIPVALLRRTPETAHVAAFSGAVTVAPGGPARLGQPLVEGSRIATGANSFITLALSDGSRVTLPSQSRIRIEALHSLPLDGRLERRFVIEAGRGEFSVTPRQRRQDRFLVKTPVAVAAVRGTEFRVRHQAGVSALSVVEGEVAARPLAGEAETLVTAGSGEVMTRGRLRPRPLLPPPALFRPGVQDGPDVAFDFLVGRVLHHLELARDAGFVDMFAEALSRDRAVHFARVDDGRIYLRVTSVDADGMEGVPVDYAIDRRRRDAASVAAPIRFRWLATGPDTTRYDFVLGRDPALGDRLVEAAGLTNAEYSVDALPPGTWYWQATGRDPGDGRRRVLPVRKLTVVAPAP